MLHVIRLTLLKIKDKFDDGMNVRVTRVRFRVFITTSGAGTQFRYGLSGWL